MTQLDTIDVSCTEISDIGVETIAHMRNIKSLDLGFTRVADIGISHLAQLKGLEYLRLYGNEVT
jgi:Leucine-rich repeat (LRR) protein